MSVQLLNTLKRLSQSDNVNDILADADRHHVLSSVYNEIDDGVSSNYKSAHYTRIFENQMKQRNSYEVFQFLASIGVKHIVLKGLHLTRKYSNPLFRTYGDDDIYVFDSDKDYVHKKLLENGYELFKPSGKHDVYINPEGYLLELHYHLITTSNVVGEERFIKEAVKKCYLTDYSDTSYVLSANDEVIFVVGHAVNHLKSTGFGLKQIVDISLLIENEELDWEYIYSWWKELEVYKTCCYILELCNRWMGCRIEVPIKVENNRLEYLGKIIYDGGVFGEDKGRNDKRFQVGMKGKSNSQLMMKLRTVFATPEGMYHRYPVLIKKPYLLPFVWIRRTIIVCFEHPEYIKLLFKPINKKEVNDRIELMEFLKDKNDRGSIEWDIQ